MNITASTRARGTAALIAALVLVVPAVLVVGVGSAAAHDQLLSSTPAEGSALAASPREVTLEYSDSVLTVGAIVLVVDENETNWVSGEPVIDGWTVSAQLRDELPDGAYEIRWRVVSVDGHPISGLVPFTVGDATPAPRVPSPGPSEVGTAGPDDAGASGDNVLEGSRTVLIGVGGAAVAVLLLWAVSVWNRRRRSNSNVETRQN